MFFLGMSAHLFIYLLVPAFLIVCFYFRGAAVVRKSIQYSRKLLCINKPEHLLLKRLTFIRLKNKNKKLIPRQRYSVTASRIFRYFNPFFTSLLPLPTCFYGHLLQLFKLIYSAARILPTSFFN